MSTKDEQNTADSEPAVGGPLERGVGRPVPKRTAAAAAQLVFGVLWVAGLALGDQIKAAGHDFSGAWAVLYGGIWMLMCVEIKKTLSALWQDDGENRSYDPPRPMPPSAFGGHQPLDCGERIVAPPRKP